MLPATPRTSTATAGATGPELSEDDFARVRTLLHAIAGIELAPGKQGLVRSRLTRRLNALQLTSVTDYLDRVEGECSGEELARMVDVLTTNKTEFFRERAHFDYLGRDILPALAARRGDIRLWSAGCSTGEEPYSIAMVARTTLGDAAARVRVLATDISERVLTVAREATYRAEATQHLPDATRQRFFEPIDDRTVDDPRLRVASSVRALVRFARLNLMAPWPMRGQFDAIFCRNVMIYFSREAQQSLIERFVDLLAPGGLLFVGHAESLCGASHTLQYVQPAVYAK